MQNLLPVIKFLKKLEKNNNKPWFDANRKEYDEARAVFIELVAKVIKGLAPFNERFQFLEPKQCLFRINRDVRFSKNKLPYKKNFSAYFNQDGKKAETAGYYLHIEPGNSFVAMGIWQPEKEYLFKIRQEIDYNLTPFKKILASANFKKYFNDSLLLSDALVRAPKGFAEDLEAIKFIKLKSFVVRSTLSDKEVLDPHFYKKILLTFKAGKPFVDFLNTAFH